MKLNEKGITLVELIAALALVTLVAGIAWTAINIGMQHGAAETEKTQLQQDSNIIISTLLNIHRRSDSYTLYFEADTLKIESCDESGSCNNEELDMQYDFNGTKVGNFTVNTSDGIPDVIADLTPEKAHTELTLVVTDLNNPKRSLSIETTLTRMLTNPN